MYSVRPNANVIQPGESLKVSINLQAFSQPLSKFYKCKDKFLIVALPCSKDTEGSKVSQIWSDLEKANESSLFSKKLKVNYVIDSESDDIQEEEDINNVPVIDTGIKATGTDVGIDSTEAISNNRVNAPVKETANTTNATIDSKEDLESYNQINELSEKLDKTESEDIIKPAKTDDSFGISLPLTVILMVLAFFIGWLIF